LFSGIIESAPEADAAPVQPAGGASARDLSERIGRLEKLVEQLRLQIEGR